MADDDLLTPLPSQPITPVSISNTKALPINPTDRSEQTRSQISRNLVSLTQLTNEWQLKAQQHNVALNSTTSLTETTKPTYLSPASVPQVPPLTRPPPKPPDLQNYEQNTPQPSKGPPRRVFNYSTNTLPPPTATKQKRQNKALTRTSTSTAVVKQASEITQGQQPVLSNGPNNIKGQRPTSPPMPPLYTAITTAMLEEKPTGITYQSQATTSKGCFSPRPTTQSVDRQLSYLYERSIQETQRRIDRSGTLPKSTSNKPQQQSGRFAKETRQAEVMQWKQTRAFYTTSGWPDIFPAQQKNFPLLGESVLVWTMLPTLDTLWLRTYAWTEELDKVQLPPYIISKALWNQRSRYHSQRSRPSNSNHHCPRQQPQTARSPSLELPSNQQPPSPPTHWTRDPTPINHLAPVRVIPSKVTHTVTPVQSDSLPHNSVIKGEWNCRASAAIVYWLLTLNTMGPQPSRPFLPCLFSGCSYRFHRQYATKIIKFRTSYWRWITAIIQQRWVTAWDLLAHRNVEDKFPGMAGPYKSD